MRLIEIEYVQYEGLPKEWRLNPLTYSDVNLVVGRNATGKTKTLSILYSLSLLLSGVSKMVYDSGRFHTKFDNEGSLIEYTLQYSNAKVEKEVFTQDGNVLLSRGEGGRGEIFTKQLGRHIEFQTPEDELAVVARRDSIQHDFFEPLYEWASSLRFFQFSLQSLQSSFIAIIPDGPVFDTRNTAQPVAIFRRGEKEFGDQFRKSVTEDMRALDYPLQDVFLQAASMFTAVSPGAVPLTGLAAKEIGLSAVVEQIEMSQGMLRALSVIISLNYAACSGQPSCIVIDDIGEGLDYGRSCAMIGLLMRKVESSGVQLIMSTNDRFVMNAVPLENWTILQRKGGVISSFNYQNSQEKFDDFKYTGLNNFDFFTTDFVHEGLMENE